VKKFFLALLAIILLPILVPIAMVAAAIIIYTMVTIAGFVFLVLIHLLI
jgi:hypothetical protein